MFERFSDAQRGQNLQKYFDYFDKSVNRNTIDKDVSPCTTRIQKEIKLSQSIEESVSHRRQRNLCYCLQLSASRTEKTRGTPMARPLPPWQRGQPTPIVSTYTVTKAGRCGANAFSPAGVYQVIQCDQILQNFAT